ncbi:hypothetical protein [Bacteroides cellulosilyticus]|jgi:lipoprotein|uniref:hypothetical protein n=1 Tax=Bacteroides cellulosilyticus TaxID=246787 RepID=UPI0018A0FAF7|nr:hypothetical protein [Bacteroides cellulosilyticus]
MRTLKYVIFLIFICTFFLSSCSKDTEEEYDTSIELKFYSSIIGLWEGGKYTIPDEVNPRSMEILPFTGYQGKLTVLFVEDGTVIMNENRIRVENDKLQPSTETIFPQKCKLVEVNYPNYTLMIIEGKNLGKRMSFKYIPDKKIIEWEVYFSLGFIQKLEYLRKVD